MLDRLLTTFLLRPRSNPSCNVTCHRRLEYPIAHRPASGELEDSQIVKCGQYFGSIDIIDRTVDQSEVRRLKVLLKYKTMPSL